MVPLQDDPITFSEGRNCIRKVDTLNPFTCTQSACFQPYREILNLNQSHFLTIRVSLNHNSMVSLQDDPISFSEGRNCIRKVATLKPLTYTQSACSQHYRDILNLNQSHFLTIRVSLNHNSMVSLQDDPISFSEGRNCIRKVATLNSLTYTQSACSQNYKDILHLNQSHFLTIRVDLNHNSMVSL